MTQVRFAALGDVLDLSDSGVWGEENTYDGVSVLRSTNFNTDGTLDFSRLTFRKIEPKKRESKLLQPGDILLEKSGGGPTQPVGRVCLFRGDARAHSFGNFIARLRVKPLLLPEFLFFFLWHFHSIGLTNQYQKQTTGIRNLEFKRYLTIQVPIPSLPEQRRIVDLLSRAEGIVRLRREAGAKAAELIPALFLHLFGDPATNPKGWPVATLGELAAFVSGGTPTKSRKELWEGVLPWVSPKDMKSVEIVSSIDRVNDRVLKETNLKLIAPQSILIVVRGMILAHTVPVAITRVAVTINQDMKALIPTAAINPIFLLWALRVSQEWLLGKIDSAAHGTKKLDTKRLEALPIPVPPLALQHAFATRATNLQAIATLQTSATAQAQATFDALLHRAFATG